MLYFEGIQVKSALFFVNLSWTIDNSNGICIYNQFDGKDGKLPFLDNGVHVKTTVFRSARSLFEL